MSASFPKLIENIGIPRTLRDLTRAVIKFLFVIPLEAWPSDRNIMIGDLISVTFTVCNILIPANNPS
jgi:hypothetical protein